MGRHKPTKADARPKLAGPDAVVRAMRLYAAGATITDIAGAFGVERETIYAWRNSAEGEAALAQARAERAAADADAIGEGRRVLLSVFVRSTERLAEISQSKNESVALRAIEAVLDRMGLPRTERIEGTNLGAYDLSQLSEEELEALRALQSKARARREDPAR